MVTFAYFVDLLTSTRFLKQHFIIIFIMIFTSLVEPIPGPLQQNNSICIPLYGKEIMNETSHGGI